ncbi:unnamed protein product [Onchocerca flexuosa]|uniref:Uncharacterized protein n=1 Tax=Onchocerca flexuosa TaxID=387005 RepID=A0A183HBX3_9BILA|nr:unnamed protein product [Onchocerca flexuosa]
MNRLVRNRDHFYNVLYSLRHRIFFIPEVYFLRNASRNVKLKVCNFFSVLIFNFEK